jgi:hypothetical protein
MAIEDHPLWNDWSVAFDIKNEAEKRYYEAKMRNDPALDAAKHDYDKALRSYDEIAAKL